MNTHNAAGFSRRAIFSAFDSMLKWLIDIDIFSFYFPLQGLIFGFFLHLFRQGKISQHTDLIVFVDTSFFEGISNSLIVSFVCFLKNFFTLDWIFGDFQIVV